MSGAELFKPFLSLEDMWAQRTDTWTQLPHGRLQRHRVHRPFCYGLTSKWRRKQWLKCPQCHWCGRMTTLGGATKRKTGGYTNLPHTATRDHVKSRVMGRRDGEATPCVLACDACNRARAAMEDRLLKGQKVPVEWLRLYLSGVDGEGI